MANHYIRLGAENVVIAAFSDAFQKPEPLDIMIAQDAGRHCTLKVRADDGGYRYRWDPRSKKLVERTADEIEPLADLKDRVKADTIERAKRRLRKTDFKVLQHLEETAAGITPTMSAEDFQTMVQKRKVIRDELAQFEQAVDAAADRAAVNAIAKP